MTTRRSVLSRRPTLVGGPLAGKLESAGGFRTDASESSRADDQFQRATGQDAAPGIVLLVEGAGLEQRAHAAAGERSETVEKDLARAELFAFPLLLILSVLFFRGRAAVLPVVVGVTTVLGTFLVLTAVNQVYDVNVFALNLDMPMS